MPVSDSVSQVEALYMLTGALDNPLGDGGRSPQILPRKDAFQ